MVLLNQQIATFSITCAYLLYATVPTVAHGAAMQYTPKKDPSTTTTTDNESANDLSDLSVQISQISIDPPVISAVVENVSPDTTYTALCWDTPLDEKAISLGIFEITNVETGEQMRNVPIRLARSSPPPMSALVEIPAGESLEAELAIEDGGYIFDESATYEIKARGTWKAVWPVEEDEVTEEDLKALPEMDDALTAEFESNTIELEL